MTSIPAGWELTAMGAFGVYVSGIDPDSMADPTVHAAIETLLVEYHVLGLDGVATTPEHQLALGERFGKPYVHPHLEAVEGYPAILRVHKEPTDADTFGGEYWHADITFERPPAAVSLLQSLLNPDSGGDTLFADQHAALATLPAELRSEIEGRDAVHLYPGMVEGEPHSTAIHPVIRPHDITGRPALFVNPAFTVRFADTTPEASAPLLDALFAHQIEDRFRTRLAWTDAMLALWDNRSVLHHATNDYAGQARTLRRVTAMQR